MSVAHAAIARALSFRAMGRVARVAAHQPGRRQRCSAPRDIDGDYAKFVADTVGKQLARVTALYRAAEYAAALDAATECQSTVRRHLGEKHPAYPSACNNLALIKKSMGELTDAATLFEKTVGSYELSCGKVHPSTATCLQNLAQCYKALATEAESEIERQLLLTQAQEAFEEAISRFDSCLDQADDAQLPLTVRRNIIVNSALCRSGMASVLRELGKSTNALELLEEALTTLEAEVDNKGVPKSEGTEDSGPSRGLELARATIINNIAFHHRKSGNHTVAAHMYLEALHAREALLPPGHQDVLATAHNLAELYDAADQPELAVRLREKILHAGTIEAKDP